MSKTNTSIYIKKKEGKGIKGKIKKNNILYLYILHLKAFNESGAINFSKNNLKMLRNISAFLKVLICLDKWGVGNTLLRLIVFFNCHLSLTSTNALTS